MTKHNKAYQSRRKDTKKDPLTETPPIPKPTRAVNITERAALSGFTADKAPPKAAKPWHHQKGVPLVHKIIDWSTYS
jgi:hypothetical protein